MPSDPEKVTSIGALALMTGLSIPRLRCYHDMGLLVPDHVDESTGYRSYSTAQIGRGKAIARLRQADLPLEEIEPVLEGCDDPLGYMPIQAVFEDNAGNRVNVYPRAGDW